MPRAKQEPQKLVKMSVLARLSEVPAATIKHYLREGLLAAAVRTSRNMALYDVALVPRIRAIKELQRARFLPLKVIKDLLASGATLTDDATAAEAIARVLESAQPDERRTRAQLLSGGMPPEQLTWLRSMGLVAPEKQGGEDVYSGDDLELLRTLGAARRVGLSPEMLPLSILETYLHALRELVRAEMQMFRSGVLPRAAGNLGELAGAATTLSERLVVLLRRKLLVPTLTQLVKEESQRRAADGEVERRKPRARRSTRE